MTHFLPLFLKSSIFYFCYSPSHNLDKHIIDHCQEDENAEEDQSVTFVKYPLGEPRGFYAGCPALAPSEPEYVDRGVGVPIQFATARALVPTFG